MQMRACGNPPAQPVPLGDASGERQVLIFFDLEMSVRVAVLRS
jgi:hypothetical protein